MTTHLGGHALCWEIRSNAGSDGSHGIRKPG